MLVRSEGGHRVPSDQDFRASVRAMDGWGILMDDVFLVAVGAGLGFLVLMMALLLALGGAA